jgi:hypothetical protein
MVMAKSKVKEIDGEGNVDKYKPVTIRWLLKEKSFNRGYHDFKAGIWDHAWYENADKAFQIQYERGRHYAAAGGPPIKDGRTTNQEAIVAFYYMWQKKEVLA